MSIRPFLFALAFCFCAAPAPAGTFDWPQVCMDAYRLSESGGADPARVIALYDECLAHRLPPRQQSMILYNRANAKRRLGRLQAAIADYDHCLKRDPDNASAWGNRAFTLGELGRTAEARDSASQARALDPDVRVPGFD